MIDDRDVWRAATVLIVKRYGDDAMLEAAQRADQMLGEGDMAGAETWRRILNAIERLQPKALAEGRPCIDTDTAPVFRRRSLNQVIVRSAALGPYDVLVGDLGVVNQLRHVQV